MNESTPPSGDRLNFPSAVSAGASERQSQYRERHQGSGGDGGSGQEAAAGGPGTDALISLVQDLTQQNHFLSSQVEDLKGELASAQAQSAPSPVSLPNGASAGSAPASGAPAGGAPTDVQVSYLLNQLEFAQQANQRQAIRIESLAQQVNADRVQLLQLEQDSQAFQKRCRTQSNRIEQLEQRCEELQQRLQRQQRYTLQFKTALDKCLEVPPPSYVAPESYATPETSEANSVHQTASTLEEDLTALVSPLLPKTGGIPTWSAQARSSAHRFSSAQPSISAVGVPIGAIRPLKPEPQVPQMSRFKTTLFNLAHQAQGAQKAQAIADPNVTDPNLAPNDIDASDTIASVSDPSVSANGSDTVVASAPVPEAATPPSSPQDINGAPATPTSADDAFWSDLVQMVGSLDLEAPSPTADAPQPTSPQTAPAQPASSPPADRAPSQQAAKSHNTSEGVDTIFDVVIQGAKAIASQLMPSETNAADAQGPELPQMNATAPSSPVQQPSSSPAIQDPLPEPVVVDEAAGQATTPAAQTAPSPLRSQGDRPSPRLSPGAEKRDGQKPVQESRHIIDLPTFLRPQPQ